MYTSGSTGRPKGVAVAAPRRRPPGARRRYADFGPREVFLQLAPPAFDAATFEIWGALLARRPAGGVPAPAPRRSTSWSGPSSATA